MIELTTKAEKYAAENTNEVMTNAIAQAYADGYHDGYNDREEEIPVDLRANKTEYVDLGLPSGTMWAKEYEKKGCGILYLPYIQAKRYNLPTREQWEELVKYCKWGWHDGLFRCIGKNGVTLDFCKTGRVFSSYCDGNKSFLWLLENSIDDENAFVYLLDPEKKGIGNCFMGYKLPIRQVR